MNNDTRIADVGDAIPATIDPAKIRNMALNAILQEVDDVLSRSISDPSMQMGILAMAQALTFRRVLEAAGSETRGHRQRLIKLALRDIEDKLRKYGIAPGEPDPLAG